MTTELYIIKEDAWEKLPVYNRTDRDERLDEQFDTGIVLTISEDETPFEEYSLYKTVLSDGTTTKELFFFGFDTVEERGEGYYIHTIELVELTRWAMGIFIDGKRITQPITSYKKTLYGAYGLLLLSARLVREGEVEFDDRSEESVQALMENTISPEFYWNAGTSLWECLVDVGNVINCIPRFIFDADTHSFGIKFEKINDVTGVYDL